MMGNSVASSPPADAVWALLKLVTDKEAFAARLKELQEAEQSMADATAAAQHANAEADKTVAAAQAKLDEASVFHKRVVSVSEKLDEAQKRSQEHAAVLQEEQQRLNNLDADLAAKAQSLGAAVELVAKQGAAVTAREKDVADRESDARAVQQEFEAKLKSLRALAG